MAFEQYLGDVHVTYDSGWAKRAQDRDDQFWDTQLDYEHGFESSSRRDKDNKFPLADVANAASMAWQMIDTNPT